MKLSFLLAPSSLVVQRLRLGVSTKRSITFVGYSLQKLVNTRQYYSSKYIQDGNSDKSILEFEKELFAIRRNMMKIYTSGHDYPSALACAIELMEKVASHKEMGGKETTLYASCLNNIALMHKMCGNNEEATNFYTQALHVYQDIMKKCAEILVKETSVTVSDSGSLISEPSLKNFNKVDEILELLSLVSPGSKLFEQLSALSTSYASTLSNLGVLYKQMAEIGLSPGSEKVSSLQLLVAAEEALLDACALRTRLLGPAHRDSLYSEVQLCGVRRLQGRGNEALEALKKLLDLAVHTYGDSEAVVATIHGSLSLLLKSQGGPFPLAQGHATQALAINRALLGEHHQETVVSKHNLAELLLWEGSESSRLRAEQLQRDILQGQEESTRPNHSIEKKVVTASSGVGGAVKVPMDAVKEALQGPTTTYATRRKKKAS